MAADCNSSSRGSPLSLCRSSYCDATVRWSSMLHLQMHPELVLCPVLAAPSAADRDDRLDSLQRPRVRQGEATRCAQLISPAVSVTRASTTSSRPRHIDRLTCSGLNCGPAAEQPRAPLDGEHAFLSRDGGEIGWMVSEAQSISAVTKPAFDVFLLAYLISFACLVDFPVSPVCQSSDRSRLSSFVATPRVRVSM
jgi:hypothetical protein